MKAQMMFLLLVCSAQVLAQDTSGTCPTIHGCAAPGVTEEQWKKDTTRSQVPGKSQWERETEKYNEADRKVHYIKAAIGLRITADELFTHNENWCNKINRTFTKHGEHDQVICGDQYIYIENGVITAIQK